MSDEEAFLAAIRANPADDAPRLVYADWLREQGRHEQAEAIRAEYQFREAKALWEQLQMTLDPDWAGLVFPVNGLVLRSYPPDRKSRVIKLIREVTSTGLAEAKALSESLPARIGGCWPPAALDRIEAMFADAGAVMERQYILPADG
ncbi:MAG: ribosomal protein L7/L12 [Zavarzinella sp.]|nr:ribosomal protein L7/L12 [Zavarzinella sp.]